MPRELRTMLVTALMLGFSVTLLLGLFPNRVLYGEIPSITIAYEQILGVGYWGYLLPWLRRIVYPGSALEVAWGNFIADVIIWTMVAYALIFMIRARDIRGIKSSI